MNTEKMRPRGTIRGTVVAVLLLTMAACGEERSPVSPSPTPVTSAPSLPLHWSGRIEATYPTGGATSYSVDVLLDRSGSSVTGTWRDPNGTRWNGTINGTVTTDLAFRGTTTWDAEATSGGMRCRGRGDVSGSLSLSPTTLAGSDVVFENCEGALTGVQWVLTISRQR